MKACVNKFRCSAIYVKNIQIKFVSTVHVANEQRLDETYIQNNIRFLIFGDVCNKVSRHKPFQLLVPFSDITSTLPLYALPTCKLL